VKVLKFGGTSVRDAKAIQNVIDIVTARHSCPLLVVVSACGGVTNSLLTCIQDAAEGHVREARGTLAALRERHLDIANDLIDGSHGVEFVDQLRQDCLKLERALQSISVARSASAQARDEIVSFGERWSSRLLCYALEEHGLPVALVDARKVLMTNNEFSKATPVFEETNVKARELMLPLLQQGKVVVTQGFIGSTRSGLTTTLGRGGSDYSASIFGSALDADEIQIWTDTDGILTADPSITPGAMPLREISVEEATELAHFGAKVLHPSTLAPAMSQHIPVHVLNSMNPFFPGTLVKPTNGTQLPQDHCVKSITGKKGVCTVAIRKDKGMNTFHFLQHVFDVLQSHKKGVEFISNSETGVLVLTNDEDDHSSFIEELRYHEGVDIRDKLAIVCVVGRFVNGEQSILSRVQHALLKAHIPIYFSYNGISKHSVAVVVEGERFEEAVRLLHAQLIDEGTR
jgi:aspartate kinase